MKLALDLDGTISADPVMFAQLAESLVKDGHQVIVLTGALTNFPDSMKTTNGRIQQLSSLGFELDKQYTYLHICIGSTGGDVANQKREFCAANNIDFLIDNEPLYVSETKKVTSAALYFQRSNS